VVGATPVESGGPAVCSAEPFLLHSLYVQSTFAQQCSQSTTYWQRKRIYELAHHYLLMSVPCARVAMADARWPHDMQHTAAASRRWVGGCGDN